MIDSLSIAVDAFVRREQEQEDQLEHTYSSSVRIRNVALKTNQSRWTIGKSGERGSGISVLAARHDDNDDDECANKKSSDSFKNVIYKICLQIMYI